MEPFIGQIMMFGGNFAPRGWALCDGQLLAISQNSALFSILGTTYGGDGRTTFGLPDLRGRVPLHPGSGPGLSPRQLGQKGGTEDTTLSVGQLPAHGHTVAVPGTSAAGNTASPADAQMAAIQAGKGKKVPESPYNQGGPADAGMLPFQTGDTGSNAAHDNMPPFQGVNFIIALVGIYPSRN